MGFLALCLHILSVSFFMFWEVLWPLILGFLISAIIQALVSHQSLAKILGGTSPRYVSTAALFGIASSSCSYAAVALARSLFQKGASFTSAIVFQIASTNLVIELGIILVVFLGWQFMAAEFIGGIIMVTCITFLFHLTLSKKLISSAKIHADRGLVGKMEGHAAMDMSVSEGTFFQRLISGKGFTAVSEYFVMDIVSIWVDVILGFLIAGMLAVIVPHSFWHSFFLTSNSAHAKLIGPLLGPLIAVISFVCSVGNVPLAAVLWQGGMSFGGVVSFIFADLIVLPILDIYRKYYGWKVMIYLFITFFLTTAFAGYCVEFMFSAMHMIPESRIIFVYSENIQWNYTSWLNIIFLIIATILVIRFIRSGGVSMIKMMNASSHVIHHH